MSEGKFELTEPCLVRKYFVYPSSVRNFLKKHVTFLPGNSLSSTGEGRIMIDYSHNSTDELDSLVGLTIKGWQEVKIDWGHSFVLLETNQKFEDGKTVYLCLSQDAEMNAGGYIGFVSKDFAKQVQEANA